MIALGHEYVCGFNVAVNDSPRVCRVESVGNLDGKRKQHSHLKWTVGNPVLERAPIQKLHGDKGPPILLAKVVNRADIGVIERGWGRGRALETGERLRVAGYFLRQKLEGDKPSQACILGLVDYAHAAAAQLLDNAVVRDGLVDHSLGPGLGVASSYGGSRRQSTSPCL